MRRRLSGAVAAVVITAGLVAVGPAGQAIATTPLTSPNFIMAPIPGANGQPRPYFKLSVAPGRSTTDVVVFSNTGPVTLRYRVGVTVGMTAGNSGSAFGTRGAACAWAACWVSGLPPVVTLPPHSRDSVQFGVTVPASARPSQYLAGITATPDVPPQRVKVGSTGHTTTQVLVVSRVIIGVAVTVGDLASLRTMTAIAGVTAGWVDGFVRLTVRVRNPGQRFTEGNGAIACSLGSATHSYRLAMDTVLPGQGAGLAVNGFGMRTGTWRCAARIKNSSGGAVVWTGLVTVPSTVPAATKEIAPNQFVPAQSPGIPLWAIILMVLGGLILISLWAAILLRRQRNRNTGNPTSG
jgi:hypothetical protein